MPSAGIVLEHGMIVQHDRVATESLALANGFVANCADGIRLNLRDHLIFPGLINAHDHLQLNNIPPLPQREPFGNSYEWIGAMEAHRHTPEVLAATSVARQARHWHGGLKNVLAGATTVVHHDPRDAALDDDDFPVDVPRNFSWSHSIGLGERQHGRGPRYGPLVRASFATTAPDIPWMIHLSEGVDDVARAELAQLDALGCLAGNTILVHGVALSCADIELILARGAAVVWCPSSNLRMFGRTLDVAALFAGGRVTLGTDSRLTGSRDLLDELRVAAGYGSLTSRQLLRLVTDRASVALRLPDRGGLQVGQRADCVILRAGDDPYDTLIGARRSDICAVVRGGVPVVADPEFAEWFAYCGVETVRVSLDGRAKLLARPLAQRELVELEPGLELT